MASRRFWACYRPLPLSSVCFFANGEHGTEDSLYETVRTTVSILPNQLLKQDNSQMEVASITRPQRSPSDRIDQTIALP
jgi:hypothetical protein